MSEHVSISPQALALVRNLKDTSLVGQLVCQRMDYQNELTTAYIQQHFLSGPGRRDLATLGIVTGLLRRSARPVKAVNLGGVVVSGLGSNVRYAAAHEFGVDEVVNVPAHTRRNSAADRFTASGQEVNRTTALRMGVLSKKQASPKAQASGRYVFAGRGAKQSVVGGAVQVRAHTMHMRLAARRCFQRGLEARLPEYGADISAAIVKQWGAN